jgi:hypothetical protein
MHNCCFIIVVKKREMISIFRAAVARDAAPFLQVCKNVLEEGESSKSQRTLSGRKV